MQVKLNKAVKDDKGNIFAKGSTIEFLTKISKSGEVQVNPINAVDEANLPLTIALNEYQPYGMVLSESDYTVVEAGKETVAKVLAFNYPGSDFEDDDPLTTTALMDVYADKAFEVDVDGVVKKKGSKEDEEHEESETKEEEAKEEEASKKTAEAQENMLVDSNEDITTDFDPAVGGSDKGVDEAMKNQIAHPDESTKPVTQLFNNPLTAGMKDLDDLAKRFTSKEDNNLVEGAENITTDFDTAVDGSGKVVDNYSEDTSEKKWKNDKLPNLPK